MHLNRRRVLATSATAVLGGLAGCSVLDDGGGGGDDGGPKYETDQESEMRLTLEAFPDGWLREDSLNQQFDRVFTNEDQSVIVMLTVDIFEETSMAEDRLSEARSGFDDATDHALGDEAFTGTQNDELAYTIFRDSNALGQVVALRESDTGVVPDESRSEEYAEAMYDRWQDL
jgi:hypothetical protein